LEIEKREWALAISFAVLGIIFASRNWILLLNKLNPYQGFLVYYAIIFLCLFILAKLGLVIFDTKVKNIKQVIGMTLIFFAFFVIFNWTSPYINQVTTGSLDGASKIFYFSEDGVLWTFWYNLTKSIDLSIVLTYVLSPFLIVLLASLLIRDKPKFIAHES